MQYLLEYALRWDMHLRRVVAWWQKSADACGQQTGTIFVLIQIGIRSFERSRGYTSAANPQRSSFPFRPAAAFVSGLSLLLRDALGAG